jgi:ParB-like chromosome segregation protein Spo0J
MKLTNHWVADIFPLNDSDIERLAEDIKTNGQRQPIITWQGQIIDGRTRYAACKKAGVDPVTEEYKQQNGEVTDDELLALSWSLNEARRHLTTSQRACAAAEVAHRMPENRGRTSKGEKKSKNGRISILDQFDVSNGAVGNALTLLRESPDLFQQVKRGDLTVGAAHEAFGKTKDLERAEVRRNSLAELREQNPDLAEQVESERITIDEAREKIESASAAKRQRADGLAKVMTGVFVALSGLQMADESLAELKASVAEAVGVRQSHQLKDDRKRLSAAIALLNEFLTATNERK